MPSLHEAYWRHTNLYLSIIEEANNLFNSNVGQEKGLVVFDLNSDQIDSAISWLIQLVPTDQTDFLLVHFVDALSMIGIIRYGASEILIPLYECQIAATQRLSIKELEADAIDGLGILYAYLGHLPRAIDCFQHAKRIADGSKDKELRKDIKNHIRLANKQLEDKNMFSLQITKVTCVLRLIPAGISLRLAQLKRDRFSEIKSLNRIANILLTLEKWDISNLYFQRAKSLSQTLSYRFGQLEASMGLFQVEISQDARGEISYVRELRDLSSDFEWGVDVQVMEALIEIIPTIDHIEAIANYLAKKNDPMANEIFQQLDQIMLRTEEIVTSTRKDTIQKHEVFITALQGIRDNLARVVQVKERMTMNNQEQAIDSDVNRNI